MDLVIRDATVADAAGIAPVHVRSWQAAYRGLFSDDLLDGLDIGQRTEQWTSTLSRPSEGARLVAEVDGTIVGFLVGTRTSPSLRGAGEVFSIYLDPAHWRGGMGSTLLGEGVATLRCDGAIPIVLWVLEGNDPSRRFYEAKGWRADGATRADVIAGESAVHVRYRLD